MAKVATRGTTVVMSIHQPRSDIFQLFDRVVLLAKVGQNVPGCNGVGRVVYCGTTVNAAKHLRTALGYSNSMDSDSVELNAELPNAQTAADADDILDLCSGHHADHLAANFDQHPSQRESLERNISALGQAADAREMLNGRHGALAGVLARAKARRVMFHTELAVLSQRLLIKAARHPMLVFLHYGGSIFMAITLGSIFSHMGYTI